MVFLSNVLGYVIKKVPRKYLRSGFMDSLRINVRGGSGGAGLPRYGGIGGKGGSVWLVAEKDVTLEKVNSLARREKFHATFGGDSSARGLIGEPGKDVTIKVPPGVQVYSEAGVLVGDLNEPDAKLLVAAGGVGGCPETGFSGQAGQRCCISLDLKLIADVGLVGFPNAGKSTLLRAVSHAKPKVAAYPFTTLRPHLGIMNYPDHRKITVADLPGLIEGAHMNVGRGHKFLKHLMRTKLLAFVVDIQGFQLFQDRAKRTCLETIVLLNKEVELYEADLLDRPAILIVNKMDTPKANEIFRDIEPFLADLSGAIESMPEEMRPERSLRFDQIITTSLMDADFKDVVKVKSAMRNVLDRCYEQEHDERFDESDLVARMRRETEKKAPLLV